MFLPLADIFFLDLSALGDKILQPFFVTLFQRIPIVGQVFDEQMSRNSSAHMDSSMVATRVIS